jgi:hypothetical protein
MSVLIIILYFICNTFYYIFIPFCGCEYLILCENNGMLNDVMK